MKMDTGERCVPRSWTALRGKIPNRGHFRGAANVLECIQRQDAKRLGTQWQIYRRAVAQLAQNKNVAWVSKACSSVHGRVQAPGLGAEAAGQADAGDPSRERIDPDMLGRKRIENLSMRVNDLGRAGGDFSDQRVYKRTPGHQRTGDMSLEDRVLWLTNELAYTKQEVEFLKTANGEYGGPEGMGIEAPARVKYALITRPSRGRKPAEHRWLCRIAGVTRAAITHGSKAARRARGRTRRTEKISRSFWRRTVSAAQGRVAYAAAS